MKVLFCSFILLMSAHLISAQDDLVVTYQYSLKKLDKQTKSKIDSVTMANEESTARLTNMLTSLLDPSVTYRYKTKINNEYSHSFFDEPYDPSDQQFLNTAAILAVKKGDIYIDFKKEQVYSVSDFMGEASITSQTLPEYTSQWQIHDEYKYILGFQCRRASRVMIRKNGVKNEIEAWFDDEIVIPSGPADYCGLPGLILELTTSRFEYNAVDIEYKKSLSIKLPKSLK